MDPLDETFATGPETLVAQTPTIVVGTVSAYAKEVKELSQGTTPIPVRWLVSGSLDHVETVKGTPPKSPVRFGREEHSPFLPATAQSPAWQAELGALGPDDKAVVFLGRQPNNQVVLPSGKDDRDLLALVRLIVAIQGLGPKESQREAWEKQLKESTPSNSMGRAIALRSLMRLAPAWSDVAPTLRSLMIRKDADTRRFAFGLVAYEIIHDKWSDSTGPADFLCTQLASESDTGVAESHREYVELVRQYALDDDFREQRKPLQERLRTCSRRPRR